MCECGKGGKMRRGMCGACYARWLRRQPQSLRDRRTPAERFWSKITKTATCWLWLGTGTPKGYGQFAPHGRHVYAHRFAYELLVGPIPPGLTVDHLCRTRRCVNPAHMDLVPRGVNALRGNGPAAVNARKEKCPCGRDYDRNYDGHRRCSQCDAERHRRTRLGEPS